MAWKQAIEALPEKYRVHGETLATSKSHKERVNAAAQLDGVKGSISVLKMALKDRHPLVRDSAAKSLSFEEAARSDLTRLLRHDSSPIVRGAAAWNLPIDAKTLANLVVARKKAEAKFKRGKKNESIAGRTIDERIHDIGDALLRKKPDSKEARLFRFVDEHRPDGYFTRVDAIVDLYPKLHKPGLEAAVKEYFAKKKK